MLEAINRIKWNATGSDELSLCYVCINYIESNYTYSKLLYETFPENDVNLWIPKVSIPNNGRDLRPINFLPEISKRERVWFQKSLSMTTAALNVIDDIMSAFNRKLAVQLNAPNYSNALT